MLSESTNAKKKIHFDLRKWLSLWWYVKMCIVPLIVWIHADGLPGIQQLNMSMTPVLVYRLNAAGSSNLIEIGFTL